MFEDDDCDVDLNLLQELLEKSEKLDSECSSVSASRAEQKGNSSSNAESNKASFDSVLETLDKLPVKISNHKKLLDITSTQNHALKRNEKSAGSAIHTGDTDSSDDEDSRQLEQRYNEYGADVKKILIANEESRKDIHRLCDTRRPSSEGMTSWKSCSTSGAHADTLCLPATKKKQVSIDVYTEPMIGIRIVNPLVSSSVLKERLVGRKVVSMSQVKHFVSEGKHTEDWVLCGVIVSKTPPKTSSKGSMYSIIKLSDLRGPGDLKTVSLFLFSRAFKNHGKDTIGTVLGILNPGVLDNSRNHGDEACLSVDNPDRVMVLGRSKDFGTCKSKKKNGENCTSIVNTANCEYCVYHVKQEYQKCSRRSDIQSSFNGQGLANLRNKVLGKNEVFYGGQSYSAIPAKKSKKLTEKDSRRLMILSGQLPSEPSSTKAPGKCRLATSVELSYKQAQKDSDRLRKLILDCGEDSDSQSKNMLPAYNPDEIKLDEARSAALTLIASKKEVSSVVSGNGEHSTSKSQPSFKASVKDPLFDASALTRDAAVMRENAPSSRGVAATLSLNRKHEKCIKMMPSSLGLGFKLGKDMAAKPVESAVVLKQNSSPSAPPLKPTSFEGTDSPNIVKTPIVTPEKPKQSTERKSQSSSLDSKKLFKIASAGLDMESRLLKQAAQKAAEQEAASKLGPNATPSMLGLGRVSSQRVFSSPQPSKGFPVLGAGLSPTSTIDLDAPVNKRLFQAAKLNAINLIRRSGGIKREDPNAREFESRKKALKAVDEGRGVKRNISDAIELSTGSNKRAKTSAKKQEEEHEAKMARFKELMEATSRHTDLIDAADSEAQNEYFGKLEKKEQLEEKMLNTFKVACKAVRCLTCKYTSFSASEMCKTERHPLKIMDATKRFWKCGDCSNRTVSLDLIPLTSCSNCGSSRWEKTAMIRERKVGLTEEKLSIRGMEETFIGSVTTGSNLNLLVPDEGT